MKIDDYQKLQSCKSRMHIQHIMKNMYVRRDEA
jgi:hypothetical protein